PGAPEPAGGDPVPAAPAPKAVRLDRGEGDAAEFPLLADRSPKRWTERAFFVNALAEVRPARPYVVRALRLALADRFPLNRAFALRGLARIADGGFLRAYGSRGLFEALRGLVADDEDYVARTSQDLLLRMAGGGSERSAAEWSAWWEEAGQALFADSARHPPATAGERSAPADPASDADRRAAARLTSQTRAGFRVFSKLRSQGLDLCFAIDVTKSMTDELARMRAQVTEITSFMQLLLEGKARLGYVTFGDRVVQQRTLTRKLPAFARSVEEIRIFDDPNDRSVEEAIALGLEAALTRGMGWRRKARKVVLLLGDAPPLDPDRCRRLAELAGKKGVAINGLIARPPAKYATRWPPRPAFEEIARLSGGSVAELERPEDLIARILTLSLGTDREEDLRRFVHAYREVTGAADPRGR
ncbi:MAG: VWA domain-containing protein, partial [Planctomycetota bacterium]